MTRTLTTLAAPTSASAAPSELQASGRVLARLVEAMAAALMNVQRERIRPRVPRPLHRV